MPEEQTCSRCGAVVDAGWQFCAQCGATLREGTPLPVSRSRVKWRGVLAVVLGLAVLGVGYWLWHKGQRVRPSLPARATVWIAGGHTVWMAGGHTGGVTSVSFSPDGSLLASGSLDYTVKLWRVSDGALLRNYDQETGTSVFSIQFSPNGRLLCYGRVDGTVVVARNPL